MYLILCSWVFAHSLILVIGQNLGRNVSFREKFDVAVARAVAEMRILGNYNNFLLYYLTCFLTLLWKLSVKAGVFQRSIVFLWFALVDCS